MKILNPRRARTILNLAVQSLVSYLKDNNLKTIVLGISGGLDSAVMAIIGLKAVEALLQDGHSTQYIYDYIGIESQPEDLQKARLLSHEAGFELGEYDYSEWRMEISSVVSACFTSMIEHNSVRVSFLIPMIYQKTSWAFGLVMVMLVMSR